MPATLTINPVLHRMPIRSCLNCLFLTRGQKELGLAQHLRSLAAHQGAVLALHSVGASSRTQRVIGIIVVEPILHANLIRSPDFSKIDQEKVATPSELLCTDSDIRDQTVSIESPKHATLLGVAVMWIHSEHRRKGLAQHLISISRTQPSGMFFQFIGCSNKQVAFLAPTDDGTKFATRLRGDGHVLQYSRSDEALASGGKPLPND